MVRSPLVKDRLTRLWTYSIITVTLLDEHDRYIRQFTSAELRGKVVAFTYLRDM